MNMDKADGAFALTICAAGMSIGNLLTTVFSVELANFASVVFSFIGLGLFLRFLKKRESE